MFRVKKEEYVNKTFRLPLHLVEQLETLAQQKNISLNRLVAQCCDYALENLAEEPEESTLPTN